MTNYSLNFRHVVTIIFTGALISLPVFADPENSLSNDESQSRSTDAVSDSLGLMTPGTPSVDSIDGTGLTRAMPAGTDSIDGTGLVRAIPAGTDSIDGTGRLNRDSGIDLAASGTRLHTIAPLDSEQQDCAQSANLTVSEDSQMVSASIDSTNCLPSSSINDELNE